MEKESSLDQARKSYLSEIEKAYEASDKSKSYELFFTDELRLLTASADTRMKTVQTDSSNSGIPTSQNPPSGTNPNHTRNQRTADKLTKESKSGGTKTRNVKPAFDKNEIDETESHTPEKCPACGSSSFTVIGQDTRYEHKIVISTRKIKHVFDICMCNDCGTVFEEEISGRMKYAGEDRAVYDDNTDTCILLLRDLGNMAVNKISSVISAVTNNEINLSEGYICKVQKRSAALLESFREDIRKVAVQSPLLCWDDTGTNVNGEQMCMRVYCNDSLSLYYAHQEKDLLSILEDGILTCLTEEQKVMHDHNKVNYNELFAFMNLECIQHFQRALLLVYEKTEHKWALILITLTGLAIDVRKELIEKGINKYPDHYFDAFCDNYVDIIAEAKEEHERLRKTDYGYDEERRLLKMIEKYTWELYRWMLDFTLPTTDNESERALRNGVKRANKISGQFKNVERSDDKALLSTYFETCRKNGIPFQDAAQRLAEGKPYKAYEVLHLGEDLILPNGISMDKILAQKQKSEDLWKEQRKQLEERREKNRAKKTARKEAEKRTILQKHLNKSYTCPAEA